MGQVTKALSTTPEPCVLGIVTAGALASRGWPDALWACGGIELRADGLPPDEIAAAVADFDSERSRRGFEGPVILTLRLRRDGGAWPDEKAAERNEAWESLPPGTCDWVDLEVEEIASVSPAALDALRSSGVRILLSHHAFAPEDTAAWESAYAAMKEFGPDGVKFAVSLRDRAHAESLLAFARRVATEFPASCVIGMGEEGKLTRLLGPLLGCPWTYGFLGDSAVAPGQLPASLMRAFFARAATEFPGTGASDRELLDWAAALWARVEP